MKASTTPLRGIRVLDLTTFWAGPLPCAIIADLGAEVIKIEAIQRLDPFRAYGAPASAPAEQAYEWSPLFNSANRNKLGVTLNLTSDDGKKLFKRLVAMSDAVVENYSPRVLPQFGLDYGVLKEIKPSIVLASISGFGNTGPWRDYVSFAAIGEALSGISSLTGYTGEGVLLNGVGVSDAFTGLTAAFAILGAIHQAREGERGCHIDVSQLESSIPFISDAFMDLSLNGRIWTRGTNPDPARAPHGSFPARGEDAWITISVGSEAQWQGLIKVMQHPQWAVEERFSTPLVRYRNREELHRLLSAWTRTRDKEDLTRELQKHQVPAAPVRTPAEQLEDPQLKATGFFQYVEHKYAGRHPYPSFAVRFAADYPAIRRVGPMLGEDNRYVLAELLGLEDGEIVRLQESGIVGNQPLR